jgi:hypothetical protein
MELDNVSRLNSGAIRINAGAATGEWHSARGGETTLASLETAYGRIRRFCQRM